MAMRGRKPKPTHLKLVAGLPKRLLNQNEPVPRRTMPSPPVELSDDAMVEWTRISGELHRLGLLTGVDRAALAAYCQVYGRWVQAERGIAEMAKDDELASGLVIKTLNGNAIQNPLVGIANKAMADMVKYAVEFGMTPSARSRISAEPQSTDEAEAAAYFS